MKTKKVLVISHSDDISAKLLIKRLKEIDQSYQLVDLGTFPLGATASIDFSGETAIKFTQNDSTFGGNEVKSVWWRRPKGKAHSSTDDALQKYIGTESEVFIGSLFNMKKTLSKKTIKTLESLLLKDQDNLKKYRVGLISGQELEKANNQRTNILKTLINKYGFPTITTSSQKAYKTAVVIALHSGDISLLNKSINILTQTSPDEVDKSDAAFMIDKKLVLEKQPQLYGTQFKRMKNGTVEFFKIEDQKNLNRRRKILGMVSFESYKKLVTKK